MSVVPTPPPITPSTSPAQVPPIEVVAGRRSSSGRLLNLLLAVAAAVAVGGVAFAVGRATAPAPTFPGGGPRTGFVITPGATGAPGANGQPGGFGSAGGLSLDGDITAMDADSLTVQLADGTEMTFELDGETTYHRASAASATDVAVGDTVSIKVGGGPARVGGGQGATPSLTARDVTITR